MAGANPLTNLGRAIQRARQTERKPSQSQRIDIVDQAIAALSSRRDLSEAQKARGIDALKRARARVLGSQSPLHE